MSAKIWEHYEDNNQNSKPREACESNEAAHQKVLWCDEQDISKVSFFRNDLQISGGLILKRLLVHSVVVAERKRKYILWLMIKVGDLYVFLLEMGKFIKSKAVLIKKNETKFAWIKREQKAKEKKDKIFLPFFAFLLLLVFFDV